MPTNAPRSAAIARCRAALATALAGQQTALKRPVDLDYALALAHRTNELLARTAKYVAPGALGCDYAEDPDAPEICTTCSAGKGERCRQGQPG